VPPPDEALPQSAEVSGELLQQPQERELDAWPADSLWLRQPARLTLVPGCRAFARIHRKMQRPAALNYHSWNKTRRISTTKSSRMILPAFKRHKRNTYLKQRRKSRRFGTLLTRIPNHRGQPVPDQDHFPEAPPGLEDTMSTTTPQQGAHATWQVEMPLLTSRFFLYDLAKVILISGGILYLFLLAVLLSSRGAEHIGQMTMVVALMVGGLGLTFALISLVIFGNRWPMAFFVSAAGLAWQSQSRRGKRANRIAILIGALSGNPGMAGAGLLATSNEAGLLPWRSVKRVKAYPALRTVSIMNSWRVAVRLYCTPENFSSVLACVEQYSGLRAELPGHTGLPQSGRPPVAAFEILRRAGFLVCICIAAWQALRSPQVLIKAQPADFAAEYNQKFAPPEAHPLGVVEMGQALIRQLREPMTLDEYIAETTEHHLLQSHDERWAAFLSGLPRQGRWLCLDDPALAEIRGAILDTFTRTQWTAMYLPVAGQDGKRYIEFRYETRPRSSKAPVSLIYPSRSSAWLWSIAGFAIYLLLPWAKASAAMVSYDRVCIVVLDLIGMLMAGFFFALPLYASYSTADVLDSDFGMTVFLWCIAASGALFLVWSARCAAFAVMVEQGQLRIGGLGGTHTCPFAEIESAERTERNGAWTALRIECRSGAKYKFACGPLCRFEKLLEALQGAEIPLRRPEQKHS